MVARETVVVVAPGRGSYNAPELGYLSRWPQTDAAAALLTATDEQRQARGLPTVAALDTAERFRPSLHLPGKHAAGLIYACALSDFLALDQERVDVVAVTGNSMGWYLALAAAGATDRLSGGITLVEHMAALMDDLGAGGQLLYPLADARWEPQAERAALVSELLERVDGLYLSIRLGSFVVLAGTDAALKTAEEKLPVVDEQYPLRLARHAAFHSPVLQDVRERAFRELDPGLFRSPSLPLIDGRGEVWQPGADARALRDYTLGAQVTEPYDFSRAVEVAVKEFAPDRLIALGPGAGMGVSALQVLSGLGWLGCRGRSAWQARQSADPFVIGMGIAEQRALVAT